jgi:hypothetical protein
MVGEAEERMVRWQLVVDFEGANPTGITIQRNFQPGWDAVEFYVNPVSAVALTGQTAADALREHDAEVASRHLEEKLRDDDEDEEL